MVPIMKRFRSNDGSGSFEKDTQSLFRRYVDICNQAIKTNQKAFPANQLLRFEGETVLDNQFDLAVYDDRPLEVCTLVFRDQELIYTACEGDPEKAWRLSLSHIKKVIENPQDYVNDPDKLDLAWFHSRLIRY